MENKRGRDRLVMMRVNQKRLTRRNKRLRSQRKKGGPDLENRRRVCNFPGGFPGYQDREGNVGRQ